MAIPKTLGTDGNDTLRGDDLDNWLLGRRGDDTLLGLGGDDRLDGGVGKDLLNGGAGHDYLVGGGGDDTYIVGEGDTVLETWNDGRDTIIAGADHSMEADIETMILVGPVNGDGNWEDNTIIGSDAANEINASGGNDRIVGGRGNDILTGYAGSDTFAFTSGFGHDIITDFQIEGADHDTLEFRGEFAPGFPNHDMMVEVSKDTPQGVLVQLEWWGNSILIEGVTLADLRAHPEAFAFLG